MGELLTTYARGQKLAIPVRDDFAPYALKMATGSGKTKVTAMAMVWQYFNAALGEGNKYASTFLLIAPNVIVLDAKTIRDTTFPLVRKSCGAGKNDFQSVAL